MNEHHHQSTVKMLRRKLKLPDVDASSTEKKIKSSTSLSSDASASTSGHDMSFWKGLYAIECRMNQQFERIDFIKGQVAAVYNPVVYAADLHCAYLEKYLHGPKNCLFIGMNPGPWGMVQTGVNPHFIWSQFYFSFEFLFSSLLNA